MLDNACTQSPIRHWYIHAQFIFTFWLYLALVDGKALYIWAASGQACLKYPMYRGGTAKRLAFWVMELAKYVRNIDNVDASFLGAVHFKSLQLLKPRHGLQQFCKAIEIQEYPYLVVSSI